MNTAPVSGSGPRRGNADPALLFQRLKEDEARQAQVFWIAAGMVLGMPSLSMGEKLLLIALYRRVDFAKGVVDDSHAWLAKWLHISKRAIQSYRRGLAAKGLTIERRCQGERGDDATSEIALPMLAGVSDRVWQNLLRGMANPATKDGNLSPNREENIGEDRRQGAGTLADASHDVDLKKIAYAPIEVLSHWRACKFFREREPKFDGDPKQFVSINEWRQWLTYYGDAPEHLKTPAAHRQVLEIAAELKAEVNSTGRLIVSALAYWVCKAHRDGKRINSLGFIATALARHAADENFAWLFDVPAQIDAKEFENASAFARETVTILRGWKLPMWEHELTSTMRVEELAGLLRKHKRSGVVAAINCATNQLKETGNLEPHLTGNEVVTGWGWFDAYIEAVKHKEEQAAQRPRRPTQAELNTHWAQQRKLIDERNKQIREAIEPVLAQMEAASIEVNRRMLGAPAQIGWLRAALQSAAPSEVLSAAASRFIADPTRTRAKVSRWSNLGDAIRASVVEAARTAA